MEGPGIVINPHDGGVFSGLVVAGVPSSGNFRKGGYQYEGPFVDGRPHGQGQEWLENGDVFKGQFSQGQRVEGEYAWAKHPKLKTYEGRIEAGKVNRCRISYTNGDCFEGLCLDQELVSGVYEYRNRDRYEGEFLQGLRHGTGKYLFHAEGITYEGPFLNNLRSGRGRLLYSDGKVEQCDYSMGVKV
jgi:hypothetical protein